MVSGTDRHAVDRVRDYAPDALAVDAAAFGVYEDGAGEYRWRLRARDGETVADSGEGTYAAPRYARPSTA